MSLHVKNTLISTLSAPNVPPHNWFTWAWVNKNEVTRLKKGTGCKDSLLRELPHILYGYIEGIKTPDKTPEKIHLLSHWGKNEYVVIPPISIQSLESGITFLNTIEDKLNIAHTTMELVKDTNPAVIFYGDPFWKRDTLRASFWIDFLRDAHKKSHTITDWATATKASRYHASIFGKYSFSSIWKHIPSVLSKIKFKGVCADAHGGHSYMGYIGALNHMLHVETKTPAPIPYNIYGDEFCSLLLSKINE